MGRAPSTLPGSLRLSPDGRPPMLRHGRGIPDPELQSGGALRAAAWQSGSRRQLPWFRGRAGSTLTLGTTARLSLPAWSAPECERPPCSRMHAPGTATRSASRPPPALLHRARHRGTDPASLVEPPVASCCVPSAPAARQQAGSDLRRGPAAAGCALAAQIPVPAQLTVIPARTRAPRRVPARHHDLLQGPSRVPPAGWS